MRSTADVISLIYRTKPTTKSGKKELKSKKQICSEVSVNSPGNPWSQSFVLEIKEERNLRYKCIHICNILVEINGNYITVVQIMLLIVVVKSIQVF